MRRPILQTMNTAKDSTTIATGDDSSSIARLQDYTAVESI